MRYCLNAKQSREYLKKADEVMVNYNDRNFIYDLVKINPEAIITLNVPMNSDINWEELEQYKIICQKGFRIASDNLEVLLKAKIKDFQFFSTVPVRFGYQLNAMIDLGVCAIRIGGQLAHQMDLFKDISIEKRIIANATDTFLNYKPIIGAWFRPEELDDLPQIDVCEFQTDNSVQEQALYRIYAERKAWPGRLIEIIPDILDQDIMNRMLPPEFSKQRLNCKQSCMNGGSCHYCEHVCNAAKIDFIEKYKILQEKKL